MPCIARVSADMIHVEIGRRYAARFDPLDKVHLLRTQKTLSTARKYPHRGLGNIQFECSDFFATK